MIASKPRVVFKTHSFPNVSETFIVNNIKAAVQKGFDIAILVNKKNSILESSQADTIEELNLMDKVVENKVPLKKKNRISIALKYLSHAKNLVFFVKYCTLKREVSLRFIFILRLYASFRKNTVFHVHYADMLQPLLDLKKIGYLKNKVIVTFHGYDAHYLPEKDALRLLLKDFQNHVHVIHVNSLYLKNKLVSKGFEAAKITVFPIPVDVTIFNLKENQRDSQAEKTRLITVGRLIDLKGQRFGIRAIKRLKEKGHNLSYTIVGDGPKRLELEHMVAKFELQETVRFLGHKTQKEIVKLLTDHDIYLMTSVSDTEDREEAFGLVSIEAQVMGLPVVGFNSGGFPETITSESGLLAKQKDVPELVAQIELLLEDKSLYSEMSRCAIANVKNNFSAAIIYERLIKEYC